MLWRVSGQCLDNSFSLVPLERQIGQVGGVSIAGQNREQPQQAVLWENWHPHVPLRLLSLCLSQWMTVPVSTKVPLHPFTKVLNSPTNYYYKLNKYKEYKIRMCLKRKEGAKVFFFNFV